MDWKHKVTIYTLKLGFSGLLEVFGCSQVSTGQPPSKNDVLETQKSCFNDLEMCLCTQVSWVCTHPWFMRTHTPKNPNFDYYVGPTSNGHNSLNINPNHKKLIFKLNPKISNFKWNKLHSSILCESKVMAKKVGKDNFSTSFSKWFKHFKLWLLPNCCELFNYLW